MTRPPRTLDEQVAAVRTAMLAVAAQITLGALVFALRIPGVRAWIRRHIPPPR